ncbi:MAG TPA: lytic transglycosylase domain-containing protein [Pyrinomonadaceae bacterium]|nr:lytic transglycosylase domain-containing protein [Pyrinomonadaceae bacterium]
MKLPRNTPLFRSIKLAPFALIGFFVFSNITGILFSRALAPIVKASSPDEVVIPSDIPTSGDKNLDLIIFRVGEHEGVDPRFIHAVIWQESKYQTAARSHAGAEGLMQLMPDTAKRFGCSHPDNPEDNVEAGTKYLSWLLKRFDGNVQLALAGYNAGEGNVDKYNGVPPFNETQNYVRIISERYGKTYHPVLTPEEAIDAFHLRASVDGEGTSTTQ